MIDPSIHEDLKAYVDGELSPSRAAEVESAMAAHPELQQEAEFMRILSLEIKKVAADPAVIGRAKAIESVQGKRKPFGKKLVQTLVLCGLLAVISTIFFPIFAQSKGGARNTWLMSEGADAPAAAAGEKMPVDSPDMPSSAAVDKSKNEVGWEEYEGVVGGSTSSTTGGGGTTGGSTGGAGGGLSSSDGFAGKKMESKSKSSASDSSSTVPVKDANRMVIKNAELTVRVDNAEESASKVAQLAAAVSGFVTHSSASGTKAGEREALVVIRIPSAHFESVRSKIRKLGEYVTGSMSGDDVTAQYADVSARAKVMKAEEDSLITMMRATRKVSEMLELKERIMRLRAEIDSYESQAKALKDQSSFSTISTTFVEKPQLTVIEEEKADPLHDTWINAVNGLKQGMQNLAMMAINLFVYAPFWIPVLIVGTLAWKRLNK